MAVEIAQDVVVVGGGISGLYAAWRIVTERPDTKVTVLEMMPRTGGRLESDFLDMTGVDGKSYRVKDEMGGMRFNPSMVELYRTFMALDFTFDNGKIVPFNMADANTRFYLRGTGFTAGEVADSKQHIWSDLYKLPETETGKSPGTLVREVMNSILLRPENAGVLEQEMSRLLKENGKDAGQGLDVSAFPLYPEQWSSFRNKFKYKGRVINQWGLWPLLMDYGLSNEAIQLITSAIGFSGPIDQNVNAGEQLQILGDFPNNPSYFTLNAGFESLVSKIEGLLIASDPDSVRLNTTATQVDFAEGRWRVHSQCAENTTTIFSCEKVVLALPKYPLEKLLNNSPTLAANQQLATDLAGLQNMRLGKVNFYYASRWWHQGGGDIQHGGSFTDLPAGSTYVFDPLYPDIDSPRYINASKAEKEQLLNDYSAQYNGPSALTLYCDFINTNFWVQLQNLGDAYSTGFAQPEYSEAATNALVEEAHRQFQLIFGRNDVPLPVVTTYRVWSDNDYGYGYHQWKLNQNDEQIRQRIWQVADNVFLCNEAYSDMQGWVNGSLRSTDIALREGFGIGPLVGPGERIELTAEMRGHLD